MDRQQAITDTRRWLERAVIGLNLCPFAKAVYVKNQVHIAVSAAPDAHGLLQDLEQELRDLVAADPLQRDTTLLVAPCALPDFHDFNDFLGSAERLLRRQRLRGIVQLASFHPDYQFADEDPDDMGQCTNRSPYPTLHLLREDSIGRALAAAVDAEVEGAEDAVADQIVQRNKLTLRGLGPAGWKALDVGRAAQPDC